MILRFASSLFTRFAKTFGVIFILAGFGLAFYFASQVAPTLENIRYRPSASLSDGLSQLTREYDQAKEIVLRLRRKTEFPEPYAAANAVPQFRQTYESAGDFAGLQQSLAVVDSGRSAMKGYVTDTVDTLISNIERQLLAHANALRTEAAPKATPTPSSTPVQESTPLPTPNAPTLFQWSVNGEAQKETLERVRDYLGTLDESAENPENKKKLEASMSEIDLLKTLIPQPVAQIPPPPAPTPTPEPEAPATPAPLPAENVALRLAGMRNDIRGAVLMQWSLDQAYDNAVAAANNEERNFAYSQFLTRRISGELYLRMAEAIAAGLALGLVFFLIGDWTKKSGTEVLDYSCQLIENLSVSSKEVYEQVEAAVKAREIPGLETSRAFWHEGGAISAKREYLRFARERLVFEICAAPFGTGFFVSFRSSIIPLVIDPLGIFLVFVAIAILLGMLVAMFGLIWGEIVLVLGLSLLIFALRAVIARGLADLDRVFMKMPLFGALYEILLRPLTYYRIDTAHMYLQAVQQAVAESLNGMFGEKGMTLIPKTVAKPVLDRIYRR